MITLGSVAIECLVIASDRAHMSYLLGGGQIVIGAGMFVALWLALTFMGARLKGKPMTSIGFAVTPSLFLIWAILAGVLIVRGVTGM